MASSFLINDAKIATDQLTKFRRENRKKNEQLRSTAAREEETLTVTVIWFETTNSPRFAGRDLAYGIHLC